MGLGAPEAIPLLKELIENNDAPMGETILRIVADVQNLTKASAHPIHPKSRRVATVKIPSTRILALRNTYKKMARIIHEAQETPSDIKQLLQEMGQAVQELTMVPLSELFERFRKMVFDLAKDLGKQVEDLEVFGDDISVDSKLTERIRDVLVHGLCNALDHGLEAPEERLSRNKNAKGKISVHCYWENDFLVFEILDDGRGVDLEEVKKQAFQHRLVTEHTLDTMTESELLQILFEPGFSTAARVTDVSGRGVGLDVVRTTMKELNGTAQIRSRYGLGTTLKLHIPADYYQRL